MEGGTSDVVQQHCCHMQPATQVWERADKAPAVGTLLLGSLGSTQQGQLANDSPGAVVGL